jgi:hypothetical protein
LQPCNDSSPTLLSSFIIYQFLETALTPVTPPRDLLFSPFRLVFITYLCSTRCHTLFSRTPLLRTSGHG